MKSLTPHPNRFRLREFGVPSGTFSLQGRRKGTPT